MTQPKYHRKLILVPLCTLAITSLNLFAAQPKHVAVAPEQISQQRLAKPDQTGAFSHSTMLPINFNSAIKKQTTKGTSVEQISQTIYLDNSQNTPLLFLSPQAKNWQISVSNPNGVMLVDEQQNRSATLPVQSFNIGQQNFTGKRIELNNAATGEYRVTISREQAVATKTALSKPVVDTPSDGFLMFKGDPSYKVYAHLNQTMTLVNKPLQMVAYTINDASQKAVRQSMLSEPAMAGTVTQAKVTITTPSNRQRTLLLNDNGVKGDKIAGDGKFSVNLPTNEIGVYTSQLQVQGIRPDGMHFSRTVTELYPVEPQNYQIKRTKAQLLLEQDFRAKLSVPVKRLAAAEAVYLSAELWGTSPTGEVQSAAWIGGVVSPNNKRINTHLELGFDMRWLTRKGLQAPFSLKSIRLQTLDTNVPIAQLNKLQVATANSQIKEIYRRVSNAKSLLTASLNQASITPDMLMGSAPTNHNAMIKAASNPKLMLVHGYCSGDAWQNSQFSNAVEFQDFNKNRSHEEFAQLILNFGSAYSSYGIVAHSQGGAAALHLYSRYWSGLDYANGGRIIQSVGTPYQGTALAGNLAALGAVFGAGCGTNTDLTYNGASNWLSTIPSWARAEVDYYTTSFNTKWWRYDYCHLATDLFLNDPEDGTTEKWSGQLSGAVNKGHKKGWCHTGGMRDPAQTTDSNRNASMNSRAAR
jgi:pimeloyl-ACP methyl ester carboxylesterase